MNNESITDLLINHFATDKSLREIQQDYEDLEHMIARTRAANGDDSHRLSCQSESGTGPVWYRLQGVDYNQ